MTKEEALRLLKTQRIDGDDLHEAFDMAIKALEERKTGRWEHIGGDEWVCSECGYVISTEGSWEHPKEIGEDFCKHCGAKMEGSEADAEKL